jgi:hypothetical protein
VDRDAWDDDEDSGWNDEEDEADSGEEGDETVPCPQCRRPIYEDSERCPHCGRYLSEEDAAGVRKPWWIVLGVLLVLGVLWIWIAGRG